MAQKEMGAIIAARLDEKGITRKEFAKMLNVSQSAVSNWIKNKNGIDQGLVVKIAQILDISLEELMTGNTSIVEENKPDKKKTDWLTHKRLQTNMILLAITFGITFLLSTVFLVLWFNQTVFQSNFSNIVSSLQYHHESDYSGSIRRRRGEPPVDPSWPHSLITGIHDSPELALFVIIWLVFSAFILLVLPACLLCYIIYAFGVPFVKKGGAKKKRFTKEVFSSLGHTSLMGALLSFLFIRGIAYLSHSFEVEIIEANFGFSSYAVIAIYSLLSIIFYCGMPHVRKELSQSIENIKPILTKPESATKDTNTCDENE